MRLRPWLGPLLSTVDRFGVQSEQDRSRLIDLGVDAARVSITGNLKYESPEPSPLPLLESQLLQLAGDRALLVAGSTMPGEEEQVIEAFEQLGSERALLVLAPRHPERNNSVHELLARQQLQTVRRSSLPSSDAPLERGGAGPWPAVVLLDSLGELATLYRLAVGSFIGGTLVATGGHNPLEAARYGVPVAVGPSMENFREISEHFDRADAWQRVSNATELAQAWSEWITHSESGRALGQRAIDLISSHRGALERTLALIEPLLADPPSLRSNEQPPTSQYRYCR